ncbi:MAG: hypothetical protein RLZZ502_617 [Pseudomonadota bacterium]|jgi:phospholipase/carboxylesterase
MNSPLPTIELCPAGTATASVIWMHGLGADANDFVPVVPELRLPAHHKIRFVFPNAPMRPITINGGAMMQAWYDIAQLDNLERRADEVGVRASQRQINQMIVREHDRGIAYHKIFLAGFSQGGVIALQTGLRYSERLGGVLALSTYLSCGDSLAAEGTQANKDVPVLYVHGTQDAVIPLSLAEKSRQTLRTHGYQVQWQTYAMQHNVCAEEIRLISAFLQQHG